MGLRSVVVLGSVCAALVGLAPAAQAGHHRLVVPTAFRTVQAAVDAARPGDEIHLLPGVYREQVSVSKNLTVTGSGAGSTTILAPRSLLAGEDGFNSIVEITTGASVALSAISVRGPGSGSCDSGALEAGIRVLDGAHLDLSYARVAHIHDALALPCEHSGIGVMVGILTDPASGSVTIRHSEISDYISKGVVVLSAGPARISHNVVVGSRDLSGDGIDVLFADGEVTDNVVTGNQCRSPDPLCGKDFFNDFQHAGIFTGGASTVVSRNLVYGNQVGIYAEFGAALDRNLLLDNSYFGIVASDGAFTLDRDVVRGGSGGVAVVAFGADTTATLTHVTIARTTGPPVQTFSQLGFTASYSD